MIYKQLNVEFIYKDNQTLVFQLDTIKVSLFEYPYFLVMHHLEAPKRILTTTTDGRYLRRGIKGDGRPSRLSYERKSMSCVEQQIEISSGLR